MIDFIDNHILEKGNSLMLLCSILKLIASILGLATAFINLYCYLDEKKKKLQDKQKNKRH